MPNPKLSLNRRLSQSSLQRKTKIERWYAGFRCGGNPQKVLELITRKVHEFDLSGLVPLIRLEKRAKGQFFLFVAIESPSPGQFPTEFEDYLHPLPCFRSPAVKDASPFTYEQIKEMVGPAHKVEEYTNPIPFQEPQPRLNHDPFTNFEVLEEPPISNLHLINLLDWLSAKGNGSWAIFQSVCQSLEIQEPSRVLRKLKLLGHIETSPNGKKWSIAPTALAPLNHDPENVEFYLCGQQNACLRQELEKLAEVKLEGQPVAFGLPRWKVTWRDRATYDQLEKLGEIPIHKPGDIAQRLAECLPTIQEWQASLPVVGGIVKSQRHWRQYQPESQDFQRYGLPDQTGLYEMRREPDQPHPDRTLFYEADTDIWRQGDWYGLRFLSLYHSEELQECAYRPQQKQLAILATERWTQLYERALVLASGYLPSWHQTHEQNWLIYRNITPELAYWLTEKLSLTCRGL
ncbi:hypothetical protein PN441_10050 [Spirulina major CS-329]|uniref:hypothetical protein n=1 Tax=Spirulina TaxID=1154 RepID=UPI00232A993C|nr:MULTISPECIES: hypothetical protein [Spirulina]MDB9496079.1 hypothetical protein [Spirulina subsalsa CS-330]MDB9503413.1 hypothetical protein [Spirulina major CS-329]